jgi:hypothetical protein
MRKAAGYCPIRSSDGLLTRPLKPVMGTIEEVEMGSESLSFFQNRITTAYQEQTWTVALVGSMNAFIASNATLLAKGFCLWILVAGITFLSFFALAFVWSRHRIFVHYDRCLKKELEQVSLASISSQSHIPRIQELLARWSGVTLYILIIVGLWVVALRMIIVATNTPGA